VRILGPSSVIATQPESLTVFAGSPATFTVTASGTGPLTYQWRCLGKPLAGGTEATFPPPQASRVDVGN